jgi:hypothetical protein
MPVLWWFLAACTPDPVADKPEPALTDLDLEPTDSAAAAEDSGEPAVQAPLDADGDGAAAAADCDDDDPLRAPGRPETCADAADQDCDASTECPALCRVEYHFGGPCNGRAYGGPAPTSWWRFEAGQPLVDSAGGPQPVVAVGTPAAVPGVLGDALGLDGATRLAAKFVPGPVWTVSWWQWLDALPNDATLDIALDVGNGPEPYTGFALGVYTSGVGGGYLEFGGAAGETMFYDDTPVCTSGWAHRVASYDGHTLRTWVDGLPDQILTFDRTIPWGSNPLSVGGSANREDRSIRGAIDEVVWFDRALADDHVAGLFRDGLCGVSSF